MKYYGRIYVAKNADTLLSWPSGFKECACTAAAQLVTK